MHSNRRLTSGLVILALACAVVAAQTDHDKYMGKKQLSGANDIIGKKVMNIENEDLGKIHDIIVNFDSGNVPYAILSSGFAGRTKVAVPLDSLQCAADGKSFTLDASKEAFKSASKTPTERWVIAETADWTKGIEGYYGQPSKERYERQRLGDAAGTHVFTRDPSTVKGAERLLQPGDRAICEKVCEAIDNVQVDVDNGVAHLYGTVESEASRQNLETKVRSVAGVQRVESHLKVKN